MEETAEKQLKACVEWATGVHWDELMNDDETRVTVMEVRMREDEAEHMFRKTNDVKYGKIGLKCRALLSEMWEKSLDGKYLYLKQSELSKLLSA